MGSRSLSELTLIGEGRERHRLGQVRQRSTLAKVSKAKLERLLNLTALLIETPRPLTAEEIRERVAGYPGDAKPFHVAFERDKRELRDMGIPLTVEPISEFYGGGDGYRIHKRDYYLTDPGLDADELAALHMAARAVRLDGLAARDGLLKLEGATSSAELAELDAEWPAGADVQMAALPNREDLGVLFGAVAARHQVRFTYSDEQRTVDPYRLDFQRGRWYLAGFDHLREGERVYRLDRIQGRIEALAGQHFSRPEDIGPGGPAEPWQLGTGEPLRARLAVDAEQAPWIVSYLGSQAVLDERADGSVVVELPVTDRDSFRSFALIFLEHAEVLEPPELRDDMIAWLSKLAGDELLSKDVETGTR